MLTKKFFKTKNNCQVTFQLPKAIKVDTAAVAGEFNDWDTTAHPMKKIKGVTEHNIQVNSLS